MSKTHPPYAPLCWEGYESPRVLKPFERRRSTCVLADTLLSDAGTASDLLAGRATCDVLNINNAWVRGALHPSGLVRPLDPQRLEPCFDCMLAQFSLLYPTELMKLVKQSRWRKT